MPAGSGSKRTLRPVAGALFGRCNSFLLKLALANMTELTVPAGSCPYLYAWDGKGFRFVTDILGAAPLGLPLAQGRYIEADPEEFLALGNDADFPPKNGAYEVRVTEELREVLYLDQAKLL